MHYKRRACSPCRWIIAFSILPLLSGCTQTTRISVPRNKWNLAIPRTLYDTHARAAPRSEPGAPLRRGGAWVFPLLAKLSAPERNPHGFCYPSFASPGVCPSALIWMLCPQKHTPGCSFPSLTSTCSLPNSCIHLPQVSHPRHQL